MKPANSVIVTINGGSSSIKFALYQVGESLKRKLCGKIDRICERLNFLDVELNELCNVKTAAVISTDASQTTVRVIRTDEEQMIARSVVRVLGLGTQKDR